MYKRQDQPIETIAGRPGLITEMDVIEPAGDPLDDAAHAQIRCVDLPEEANFSLPAGLCDCECVPQLRDIDSDKCFSRICSKSKRFAPSPPIMKRTRGNMLHILGITTVSYTHLDVYKRQDARVSLDQAIPRP